MSTENLPSEVVATGVPEAKITPRWIVPEEYRNLAVKRIVGILENEDAGTRNHMAAASILKSVVDTNVKIDEVNDKIDRLDSGRPTEISDQGALGVAVTDLADRVSGVLGNRPEDHTRIVSVSDGSESEVLGITDRTEPGDADEEATSGG